MILPVLVTISFNIIQLYC